MAGQKSIISFFTRKTLETEVNELNIKVKMETKEIEDLTTLHDIISLL